jgi:arylsulfatase B
MKVMLQLCVFIIVVSAVSLVSGVNAKGRRPHILYILADDLGFNNVGWQQKKHSMNIHKPEVKTPVIDDLVKTGVELERMYAYRYCSPSRSSFLSGRLPIHVTQNNVSTKYSLKILKKLKMCITVINI